MLVIKASLIIICVDLGPDYNRTGSAQRFLNLLILWHNMRPFERGKRKGKSPFRLAGVRVFDPDGNETDDWLAALGYPAAA